MPPGESTGLIDCVLVDFPVVLDPLPLLDFEAVVDSAALPVVFFVSSAPLDFVFSVVVAAAVLDG
jgi:hypothetical protein